MRLPSNKVNAEGKMESNGVKMFSIYIYILSIYIYILNQARRCIYSIWCWWRMLLLTSKRVVEKFMINFTFSVAHTEIIQRKGGKESRWKGSRWGAFWNHLFNFEQILENSDILQWQCRISKCKPKVMLLSRKILIGLQGPRTNQWNTWTQPV